MTSHVGNMCGDDWLDEGEGGPAADNSEGHVFKICEIHRNDNCLEIFQVGWIGADLFRMGLVVGGQCRSCTGRRCVHTRCLSRAQANDDEDVADDGTCACAVMSLCEREYACRACVCH